MNCQIENRKRKRKTYLHCKFNRNYSAILATLQITGSENGRVVTIDCKLYTVKGAQVILFRPHLFELRNIVLSSAHQHSNDSNNSTMRVHNTTTLFILCKIMFR